MDVKFTYDLASHLPWWWVVLLASLVKLVWDVWGTGWYLDWKKCQADYDTDTASAARSIWINRVNIAFFAVVAIGTILGAIDANRVDSDIRKHVEALVLQSEPLSSRVAIVESLADTNKKALSTLPERFATKDNLRTCVRALIDKIADQKNTVAAECKQP